VTQVPGPVPPGGGPTPGAACPAIAPSPRAGAAQVEAFDPVAAVRCRTVERGSQALAVRDRSTDLAPLLAALRRPDQPRSDGMCPMIAWAGPVVTLVDAAGDTLVPRFPVDGCGLPQPAALQALQRMNWQPLHAPQPVH
jgi:hypothetical protein